MAQKILLVFIVTFTGRVLQPSMRIPFLKIYAGHSRTVFSPRFDKPCLINVTDNVDAFKSLTCFKKNNFKALDNNKSRVKLIFLASKKTKPQKKGSVAYIILPLKNWGSLYYEN